ncbi:hypothetical protein JTE90_000233 [Oedothorax gibbosus]|uniref:Uncharacterized protein n=1 Tax=Oedothorax gibbosus TaxID=931172 RepID=A0AAV6VAC0_9ARAC|nr:hypothetical protein JTE90_000233 [Oedothorax gibbosus]
MVLYHLALCYSWLILSWIVSKGNAEKRSYMTYDMTTICKKLPNFKIRMHHNNAGSTGILKATDYLSEDEETECVAKITPPRGYGVIYHLEGMELRKDPNNDCRDYIKIYNDTSRSNTTAPICRDCCRYSRSESICPGHCNYESDGLVCEEFCDKTNDTFPETGTARSLSVHFHTRCGTCTEKREQVGFRMVFTAYKLTAAQDSSCVLQSEFRCDNGRCIWSGLTCDGYNNCGDMSDESKTGASHCANFPDPMKAVIVASAVIVTVLLGVLLAYLPKMSLSAILGKKQSTASTASQSSRLSVIENANRKTSTSALVKKNSRVSFQTSLPKIREASCSESEV